MDPLLKNGKGHTEHDVIACLTRNWLQGHFCFLFIKRKTLFIAIRCHCCLLGVRRWVSITIDNCDCSTHCMNKARLYLSMISFRLNPPSDPRTVLQSHNYISLDFIVGLNTHLAAAAVAAWITCRFDTEPSRKNLSDLVKLPNLLDTATKCACTVVSLIRHVSCKTKLSEWTTKEVHKAPRPHEDQQQVSCSLIIFW